MLHAVILSNKNIYLSYAHTDNPFCFNASFQYTPLFIYAHLIFGLVPFDWH